MSTLSESSNASNNRNIECRPEITQSLRNGSLVCILFKTATQRRVITKGISVINAFVALDLEEYLVMVGSIMANMADPGSLMMLIRLN